MRTNILGWSGALVVSLLTLAACGGATGNQQPGGQAPGGQAVGGQSGAAAPTPQAVVLDKTVWWSPDLNRHYLFKINMTKAELAYLSIPGLPTIPSLPSSIPGIPSISGLTSGIPTVTLTFTAENLQADTRQLSFGSETTLTSKSKTSTPQPNNLKLAASATAPGTVAFQVDAGFSFADAMLTLGGTDTNQSIIPLAASSPVTTFVPKMGFFSGKLVGSDHDFNVTNSIIYADTTSGNKGKWVLVLTMTATFKGTEAGGGLVGTADLALISPDGSSTPGVQVVGEPLNPLNANLHTGETSPSQTVGFIVSQPITGSYTLSYTSETGAAQGQKTTFPSFSIS